MRLELTTSHPRRVFYPVELQDITEPYKLVAEGMGFEPMVGLHPRRFSLHTSAFAAPVWVCGLDFLFTMAAFAALDACRQVSTPS